MTNANLRTRTLAVTAITIGLQFTGALAIGGASLAPATAAAQGKKPPPAKEPPKDPKIVEAKKLFDDGSAAYTDGRYEDAIKAWEKSYELSGKPLIFESIASAYERLGDKKKAREYLAKWREAAPKEEHDQLDARIKNLDARIAAEGAAEAARKEKEEKERAEREAREKANPSQPKESDLDKARASRMKLVLGVGGAGVVAVLAGVALDVVATVQRPSTNTDCIANGGKTICRESAKGAIESSGTLALVGDITWITGAVLAGAGAALYFTMPKDGAAAGKEADKAPPADPTKTSKSSPRWVSVAPIVGPTGGGIGIRGTF